MRLKLIRFILLVSGLWLFLSGVSLAERLVWDADVFPDIDQQNEIIGKRDRFSKHFRQPDGSFKAAIRRGSLHYRDDSGRWQDIDREILPSQGEEFAFENTTNNLKSFFPENSATPYGIRLDSESGAINIWLEPTIIWIDEDGAEETIETVNASTAATNGNRIAYNAFESAACEFVIDADLLKQNIILNSLPEEVVGKTGFLAFSEYIELPEGWAIHANGKPVKNGMNTDASLFVIDADGNPAYAFPVPRVYEMSNATEALLPNRFSEEQPRTATYRVETDGNRYRVSVDVPLEWLSDADRDFPVVIDPTTTIYSLHINGTGFIENSDLIGVTYQGALSSYGGKIYVGSADVMGFWIYERGWSEFITSSIPDGITSVDNLVLHVNCWDFNVQGMGALSLNLYEMDVQPSTLSGSPMTVFSDIGAHTLYVGSLSVSYNGWYNIDLGASADADLLTAVNGGIDWFSVGFKETVELGSQYEAAFYGSQDTGNEPYIVVDYTGGTKPMSAALVHVALTERSWRELELEYVGGPVRDEHGRVVEEYMVVRRSPRTWVDELTREVLALLGRHAYSQAYTLALRLPKLFTSVYGGIFSRSVWWLMRVGMSVYRRPMPGFQSTLVHSTSAICRAC